MKIGELSGRTGMSIHTIRYYEKIGILKKKSKDQSGHNEYSDNDIEWIRFINCLKSTEMSLEKILDFIRLIDKGESTIPERYAILEEQKKILEEKISLLNTHLGHINYKIKNFEKFFKKIRQPY